ncbi:MAG: N(6)-L-threonylcarbamoyladenine synthase Kae1 [Nanoarchaeota archaeon]|nr:N(6)-L-threonylcarbamoyladenine synthase Kae1 [Nanoarchaeota archaeon]
MTKPFICLGIESTAHTFGIGIIKNKKVIANVLDGYKTEKGGIIPSEAAKHHIAVKERVLATALENAGISLEEIDLIAYSRGPGLAPCLHAGIRFAKELSLKLKKPIIGVNHCIAHLEIGKLLTKAKDPVLLYASGANTQVIAYTGGKYRVFGETLDMGVGNFIDTFARSAGLGFPGGPKISELADKGKELIEIPYVVKGMDVSFSGMLTNLEQKFKSGKYKIEDLAFSLQETAFPMLIEVSERAMAHLHKKELLLGGGVASNKRLQEMGGIMCLERGGKFFCPERQFLTDNGAMIAWLGILCGKNSVKHDKMEGNPKIDIFPYERTDDVEVNWK